MGAPKKLENRYMITVLVKNISMNLKFIAYKNVPMVELIREAIERFIHEESIQKKVVGGRI